MAVQSTSHSPVMTSVTTALVNSPVNGTSMEELRRHFLIDSLFEGEGVNLVYTDLDRLVVGGVTPTTDTTLPGHPEMRTDYFTERRELGIINIGATGVVHVGNDSYELENLECLYVGMGRQEVVFAAAASGCPEYYLVSAPAHRTFPTRKISRRAAQFEELGSDSQCSRRRLVKLIHPGGVCSAQLVMGYTELQEGSVWNTMPPHTHARRSEIYFYFDLDDQMVVHLFGTPEDSRHLIVKNRETVLSPPWSMHAGVGTKPYRFIWAMAGENQDFADMDPISLTRLS